MVENDTQRYKLKGLDCANCAVEIERTLKREGIAEASVDFATSALIVDPAYVERAHAVLASKFPDLKLGEASSGEEGRRSKPQPSGFLKELMREQSKNLFRILAASTILVLGLVFEKRLHN